MIGKNLTKLREDLSISQRELGRRVGISGQMISKIENDLTNPSIETLTKISEALGCSIYDLTIDNEKLQREVKIVESGEHIIKLAKKCDITIDENYNINDNGKYLDYVIISFKDKQFRLSGNEFYELSKQILNSIAINIIASENYNLLK